MAKVKPCGYCKGTGKLLVKDGSSMGKCRIRYSFGFRDHPNASSKCIHCNGTGLQGGLRR